jgi:acyl-CoA synthetase (NDP forming)
VVLIPGGLGERAGSEPLERAVRAVVAEARREGGGPVVCGGNCMGIRSIPGGYDTTFIPLERLAVRPDARPAPLAVISQSGAFAITRLDRFPHLAPRYLVTVGNQVDLTVGDFLEHVAGDEGVAVAACYVEGFESGDGTRLLGAARRLSDRGGAVILALAGRTEAGRRSARSHTAAIATDAVIAERLAAGAGVLTARSLEEFEDLIALAVALGDREFPGLRIGAVSNAGFEAVAFADGFGPCPAAEFSPATVAAIERVLDRAGIGDVVGVTNPLDLTPITGDRGFGEAVATVLDDPGVDLAVVGCVPLTPALRAVPGQVREDSVAAELADLAGHPTPWVAVVDGGAGYDEMRSVLRAAGLAVFTTADRAMGAFTRYARWRVGR